MLRGMPTGAATRARVALLLVWTCVVCGGSASSVIFAQTNTAEISGVVRDASGAVLPGAAVAIAQPASGLTVQRVTGADGRFFAPALAVGVWQVTVAFPGLASETRRLVLEVGRTGTPSSSRSSSWDSRKRSRLKR